MRNVRGVAGKIVLISMLLLFFSDPSPGSLPGYVRVRILAKYTPSRIIIRQFNSTSTGIAVEQNSALPLKIGPARAYQITIPNTKVKRRYAGYIQIDKEGRYLRIINTVSLEDYVQSVVLSEMGMQQPDAMRSQAVLARTWALTHLRPNKDYDFNDLTNSQVYKGIFPNITVDPHLLSPTYGQVLTYNKLPINVFYHSGCADRSYSAYQIWGFRQYPYYKRITFPTQMQARQPRRWRRMIAKRDINKIFPEATDRTGSYHYEKSNYRGQVGVYINNHWYNIDSFRLRINRKLGWNQLRSNHFTLHEKDTELIFAGSGFGHLVGLCQKGAVQLAKHGWNYPAILKLFYPGTKLAHENQPARVR